jgi:hypothetical protein
MFYPFTSEKLHPENLWPEIWDAETLIYALLVDHLAVLRRMPFEDFRGWFQRELRELISTMSEDHEEQQRIWGHCESELPYVYRFVQEASLATSRDARALARLIAPREILREALRVSEAFRRHVSHRSDQAGDQERSSMKRCRK